MNHAIFFDIGGVVCDDMHSQMMKELIRDKYTPAHLEKYLAIQKPTWQKIATNEDYPEADFWREIISTVGLEETPYQLAQLLRDTRVYPYWEVLGLIGELKRIGYPVGILSSHCKPWFEYMFNRFRFGDYFDPRMVVVSYKIGQEKPHPLCYQEVIRVTNQCYPEIPIKNIIYFDDKAPYAEAANGHGMTGCAWDARKDSILKMRAFLLGQKVSVLA